MNIAVQPRQAAERAAPRDRGRCRSICLRLDWRLRISLRPPNRRRRAATSPLPGFGTGRIRRKKGQKRASSSTSTTGPRIERLSEAKRGWRVRLGLISTPATFSTTRRLQPVGSRAPSATLEFPVVRIEIWRDSDQRLHPRLLGGRPRRLDPVPGRHARRHAQRLVSLCRVKFGEKHKCRQPPAAMSDEAHPATLPRPIPRLYCVS